MIAVTSFIPLFREFDQPADSYSECGRAEKSKAQASGGTCREHDLLIAVRVNLLRSISTRSLRHEVKRRALSLGVPKS